MNTKRIIMSFLTTAAVTLATEYLVPGLRVKYGIGSDIGESYFFDAPIIIEEAIEVGWVLSQRPAGPLPQLLMFCYPDKVVCVLYDDTGYIAGVQVAISQTEFKNNIFVWEKRGFVPWVTTVNGKCKAFWAISQYFVDDEYLSYSKEWRLASRDYSRLLQTGAIWLTGTDGQLFRLSRYEDDVAQQNIFKKQSCLPGMGQHYFYNMTSEIQCTTDQMYPWFIMFKDGELISTASLAFGVLPEKPDERDWFERSNANIVRVFAPKGSECVFALGMDPGVVTMHLFYVNNPWEIKCPA